MPKNIKVMSAQQEIINWVYDPLNNWLRTSADAPAVVSAIEDLLAEVAAMNAAVAKDATLVSSTASIIAKLEAIRTQVATESTQLAVKSALEALLVSPNMFFEAEGTTGQNVSETGIVLTVAPLPRKINFNQIYTRLVFGSATQFWTELLRRNPNTVPPSDPITDLDIIYSNRGAKSPITNPAMKSTDYIVYNRLCARNPLGLDEYYLRITPDNGTSNQFIYRVNGFTLR